MSGAPVVIATNGYGMAVRPVDSGSPVLTVAENGFGMPIVISDLGAPFVVEGLEPSNRILMYPWGVRGDGALSLVEDDGTRFLQNGTAGNAFKVLDLTPGAVYSANFSARRTASTNGIVRIGITNSTAEVSNTPISNPSAASFSVSFMPRSAATFFNVGFGVTGTEIDIRDIVIEQTAPSIGIAAFGDSLTELGSYNVASGLFGSSRLILNYGIGGQTSEQIAIRQGSLPLTVSVSGSVIPASGGVAVTAKSTNFLFKAGTFTGTAAGLLRGVHGLLSTDASGNWTFTRTVPGDAVPCPDGSVVSLDTARLTRPLTYWLWAGRNDVSGDIPAAVIRIKQMAAYTPSGRYLVGTMMPSVIDGDLTTARSIARVAANNELASFFGSRYVDVLGALQAENDGSAEDLSDIANGWVPRSLRSDDTHLTTAGYAIRDAAFHAAHVANGYP